MVIAQRKTLAENDQLIMELKSSLEGTFTTLGFLIKYVYCYHYYNDNVSLFSLYQYGQRTTTRPIIN